MSTIVTRFAPSPTGALHLGGARTAIFSYLWAMHNNGKFLLRIEDTDTERSKEEHTTSILASMKWLGLSWPQPLWYQSQRTPVYQQYIQQLVETNHAYYCTCTQEEVERMREEAIANGKQPKYNGHCRDKNLPCTPGAVIRLRTPENQDLHIHDCVKGTITINTKELDDMILCRADGAPTYNLAVVVDDHEMGVTDVVRGDDHVSNTPKQLLIYNALGFPIPRFAHVPMILGEDKQKLSKRHGATAVIDYEAQGILPEALVNYLVRLGWSHGDQELFTIEELIHLFTLEALNASPSAIDFTKLRWMNAHYIKTLPIEDITARATPFFTTMLESKKEDIIDISLTLEHAIEHNTYNALLESIVTAFRERVQTLQELAEQSLFIFLGSTALSYENPPKYSAENILHLSALCLRLHTVKDWNTGNLEAHIQEYISETGCKNKDILPLLRFALTGERGGPDMPVLMDILQKEECIQRITHFLQRS